MSSRFCANCARKGPHCRRWHHHPVVSPPHRPLHYSHTQTSAGTNRIIVHVLGGGLTLPEGAKLTLSGAGPSGGQEWNGLVGGLEGSGGASSDGRNGGAGGGHSGAGGRGSRNRFVGNAHGSTIRPVLGGGGGGAGPFGSGGAGGGALELNVFGDLVVEGALRAGGHDAAEGGGGGGGAGGSLWLNVTGTLRGNGTISVAGGDGDGHEGAVNGTDRPYGGGGSGGRIAIYHNDQVATAASDDVFGAFGGTLTATGGRHLARSIPLAGVRRPSGDARVDAGAQAAFVGEAPAGTVFVRGGDASFIAVMSSGAHPVSGASDLSATNASEALGGAVALELELSR